MIKSDIARVGALSAALIVCGIQPIAAMEDNWVFMPGITAGVPAGTLPPPGLYSSTGVEYFYFNLKNNSGQNTGIRIDDFDGYQQFLFVPDLPEIFGARYGAYVVFPFRNLTFSAPGSEYTEYGTVNTILSPLNLTWDFKNGFHAAVGFNLYIPDSDWDLTDVIHVGRNYWTFEPNFAITYMNSNITATLQVLFELNTVNQANKYHSGDAVSINYSILQKFGSLEFGVSASYLNQFTSDTIDGVTVPASPLHAYGNRGELFTLGPAFQFHMGPAIVWGALLFDTYAVNTAGGVRSFLNLTLPLWMPEPASAKVTK